MKVVVVHPATLFGGWDDARVARDAIEFNQMGKSFDLFALCAAAGSSSLISFAISAFQPRLRRKQGRRSRSFLLASAADCGLGLKGIVGLLLASLAT
ncbi:hypothetical protein [Bradyrhizobium sp. sBnM-33]|uniref:hypothetical protein n=1 Tax=Bradyrhizobium sp. sBnM-33 TaxID=2831780 RepID=UPI001BCAD8CD|nr:hypothetical protein [Bradyrhizobium sp. sBnM-33]WOH53689.1 hypothetical protein RX328_17350 [Bradyrhizobium sp. sBnM-33]